MCGIAGFVNHQPDRAALKAMCDRIAHRGPDDEGFFVDGNAALGHRRLSIIDLSGGHQPLSNEDGSLQIVFNGEIYNYLELREECLARGHELKTHSDTEVIVHLYEDYGERVAERLNGMWAFAIWDLRRRELFLSRDRLGKKPVYYSTEIPGYRIAFASEAKAFAALPEFTGAVRPESVADFLALSYVPEPHSIYQQVRKLPAGHSITVPLDGPERLHRYWTPRWEPDENFQTGRAIEEIQHLALDATKRRLLSDVPLGAFLSGGVDSSAIVGLMATVSGQPARTFSIGFDSEEFNELPYARQVAERWGCQHQERVVTPDVHEMLPVMAKHFDEPFGDSSAIPSLYLARMTREHVTVSLCGDGADEIFAGYRRLRLGLNEERIRRRLPEWFRHTVVRAAGEIYPKFDYLPRVFRAKHTLMDLATDLGDAYFTSMATLRDGGLRDLLSPDFQRQLGGYNPRDTWRDSFRRLSHLPPLEQMQAHDLETWLPGDILVKTDRATMAYALEGRSPFLDYRLAELAFKLPSHLKIQGAQGKAIFKQAMRPYVTDDLLYRKKMGFSVPLAQWFRTSLKPEFERLVLQEPEMQTYLQPSAARRLWQEHQSGLHNHDRKLWNLLMLALWDATHRRNLRNESVAAIA